MWEEPLYQYVIKERTDNCDRTNKLSVNIFLRFILLTNIAHILKIIFEILTYEEQLQNSLWNLFVYWGFNGNANLDFVMNSNLQNCSNFMREKKEIAETFFRMKMEWWYNFLTAQIVNETLTESWHIFLKKNVSMIDKMMFGLHTAPKKNY